MSVCTAFRAIVAQIQYNTSHECTFEVGTTEYINAPLLRDGSLSNSNAPVHVRAARPRDIYGVITKISDEG